MEKKMKEKFYMYFPHTSQVIYENNVKLLYKEAGDEGIDMAMAFFTTRMTKMLETNRLYCLTLGITGSDIEDAFVASLQDAIQVHRMNNFLAEYIVTNFKAKKDGTTDC